MGDLTPFKTFKNGTKQSPIFLMKDEKQKTGWFKISEEASIVSQRFTPLLAAWHLILEC